MIKMTPQPPRDFLITYRGPTLAERVTDGARSAVEWAGRHKLPLAVIALGAGAAVAYVLHTIITGNPPPPESITPVREWAQPQYFIVSDSHGGYCTGISRTWPIDHQGAYLPAADIVAQYPVPPGVEIPKLMDVDLGDPAGYDNYLERMNDLAAKVTNGEHPVWGCTP
ncbi:MAG: hypothetical protein HYT16_00660 [DPANN group archaeon]|nr:hypothetical protein [DPANN group archaeon]